MINTIFTQRFVKINEQNLSVLLREGSKEIKIAELVECYQQTSNECEKLISQTEDWVDALRLMFFLENIIVSAENFTKKISELDLLTQEQKELLEEEMAYWAEMTEDIKLKFFLMPQNQNIQNILAKI